MRVFLVGIAPSSLSLSFFLYLPVCRLRLHFVPFRVPRFLRPSREATVRAPCALRSRCTREWISATYFSQLNGQRDIRADGRSRYIAAPAFLSICGARRERVRDGNSRTGETPFFRLPQLSPDRPASRAEQSHAFLTHVFFKGVTRISFFLSSYPSSSSLSIRPSLSFRQVS